MTNQNSHLGLGLNDIVIDPRYVHAGKYKGKEWNKMAIYELQDIVDTEDERSILYQTARHMLIKRDVSSLPIDVSIHAINRMSSRFLGEYMNNRIRIGNDYEGIVSYIARIAYKRWRQGNRIANQDGKIYIYDGPKRDIRTDKKFVFVRLANDRIRLVTILPVNHNKQIQNVIYGLT